jgi:hypothetical protein
MDVDDVTASGVQRGDYHRVIVMDEAEVTDDASSSIASIVPRSNFARPGNRRTRLRSVGWRSAILKTVQSRPQTLPSEPYVLLGSGLSTARMPSHRHRCLAATSLVNSTSHLGEAFCGLEEQRSGLSVLSFCEA